VGFPGETDKQFQELIEFIQEYPLDQVGIFQYSQEPGSVAASLPDQVPEDVKKKRQQRLAKVQQKVVNQLLKKQIGKTLEVVVEGYHPETDLLMVGRHLGQCPDIDGIVILNDTEVVDAFGKRYLVEITDVATYDLVGTVLNRSDLPI
jgi:ribosomal protein S12 methylthiotransferase